MAKAEEKARTMVQSVNLMLMNMVILIIRNMMIMKFMKSIMMSMMLQEMMARTLKWGCLTRTEEAQDPWVGMPWQS